MGTGSDALVRKSHAGRNEAWSRSRSRCSETVSDFNQEVGLPHLRVPGLEPANECRRLCSLLDGGDGESPAARRVCDDIVFGCVRRRRGHQDATKNILSVTKGSPDRLFSV